MYEIHDKLTTRQIGRSTFLPKNCWVTALKKWLITRLVISSPLHENLERDNGIFFKPREKKLTYEKQAQL